jgi:hypothetical protein
VAWGPETARGAKGESEGGSEGKDGQPSPERAVVFIRTWPNFYFVFGSNLWLSEGSTSNLSYDRYALYARLSSRRKPTVRDESNTQGTCKRRS